MKCIYIFAIGERQLSAEVLVTADKSGKSVTSEIARQHHVNHGVNIRFNVIDDSRTAFVEHHDDRPVVRGDHFHKTFLVSGQIQVIDIARSLAVRVFSNADHDNICS